MNYDEYLKLSDLLQSGQSPMSQDMFYQPSTYGFEGGVIEPREENTLPSINIMGDSKSTEFQGLGKYATPQEFVEQDPSGFAKVNPELAGKVAPRSIYERTMAQMVANLSQPVYGPMGQKDENATMRNQMLVAQLTAPKPIDHKALKAKAEIAKLEAETQKLLKPEVKETAYTKAIEEGRAKAELAKMEGTPEYRATQKDRAAEEKDRERLLKGIESDKNTVAGVLGNINDARKLISGTTTGAVGQVLRNIGGTAAMDLQEAIDPILANLSFDRLQEMRDRSKTGGALGSIAVRELEMLQKTKASLNTSQSAEQLRRNLDKIELHYTNWQKAVDAAEKAGEFGTTPRTASKPIDQNVLMNYAMESIKKGAPEKEVMRRMQEMLAR